ncbi:hypothetical protein ACFLS1_12365, partial [Verrucomicrobiota bacterium]
MDKTEDGATVLHANGEIKWRSNEEMYADSVRGKHLIEGSFVRVDEDVFRPAAPQKQPITTAPSDSDL